MLNILLLVGLAGAAIVDVREMRIPNSVTALLGLAWLPLAIVSGQPVGMRTAIAALIVLILLLLRCIAHIRDHGRVALGGGDIKLLAVIALYLGGQVFLVLFVASLLALAWIVLSAIARRSIGELAVAIPFAPFLFVGTCLTLLFLEPAWSRLWAAVL
jgi:leader peptidase (prepilin peptidase)/N-methyltransferase